MVDSQSRSDSATPQKQLRGTSSEKKGQHVKEAESPSLANRRASKVNAGRNVKGAVANSDPATAKPFLLSREDVAAAFAFFDTTGSGVLTAATLKERLPAFYPDFTSKEYRFLLEDTANINFQQHRPANNGPTTSSDTTHNLHTTAPPSFEPCRADEQNATKHNMSISKNLSKVAESAKATRTTGNVASATVAADSMVNDRIGLGLQQLWDLIDTFQRIYVNPGAGCHSKTDSPSGIDELIVNADLNVFFDPIQQAFDVYDPHNKGMVNTSVLGDIMARIGFGELTKDELQLLVRTADFDQDGKINIDDFRRLVTQKGSMRKT